MRGIFPFSLLTPHYSFVFSPRGILFFSGKKNRKIEKNPFFPFTAGQIRAILTKQNPV
jgi:hypothetical protein